MKKNEIEDFLALELENRTLEEVLEDYDITPSEIFWLAYNSGLIDDEILEGRYNAY